MQELQIQIKSFEIYYIQVAITCLKEIAHIFEINTLKDIFLPVKKKRITVIRSPHIHKKSREQYEFRTHKRTLHIIFQNNQLASLFLEICKKIHFPGVQLQFVVKTSTIL